MNNSLPNGGFPPIKLCNKNNEKNLKVSKEREYASNIKNINIRKILNNNIKKSIIFDDQEDSKNEEIEEV
jgi:hypothetical protein